MPPKWYQFHIMYVNLSVHKSNAVKSKFHQTSIIKRSVRRACNITVYIFTYFYALIHCENRIDANAVSFFPHLLVCLWFIRTMNYKKMSFFVRPNEMWTSCSNKFLLFLCQHSKHSTFNAYFRFIIIIRVAAFIQFLL